MKHLEAIVIYSVRYEKQIKNAIVFTLSVWTARREQTM